MSESNPFSFSSSPSLSQTGFAFCTGTSNNSNEHSSTGSRPARNRVWRFKRPPHSASAMSEKGNEDDNSVKAPREDRKSETTKTVFTTPSAVTGAIPCHFEGSTYFSKLYTPTCWTPVQSIYTEESIKKEMQDESESKSPSTQMAVVSRILKGIPQNPHFFPLKAYSNVAKQRLISAWDNIFEETVDKLLSLQINGFSVNAKRLWETMEELEKMGYNVLVLRRRLVELTDVLISRRRHRTEITRLKAEAEEHRMEKSRLEFEIVKLKAKAEAEKASVDDTMARVAKMEDKMPHFDVDFTELAIKLF
ncbi:hypothetical protein RND81_10G141800 [Saponaria officinalis]|uniref:Uncharacterized protein n=1 Tax=Saponaria officinalis TaxID=3572 RepID=A0AAW1I3F2_SAPOF